MALAYARYIQIKRGRMTADERAEIDHLAQTLKNPTPGKIAQRIGRHPSTVNWYMLCNGHITRRPKCAAKPFVRKGKTIVPYSEEVDRRIIELRTQGKVFREIGEIITAEFGVARSAHSVQVRNVQLAAAP